MINKINDLNIEDFEELTTHIIQGQRYNRDFVKCGVDIYFNWFDEFPTNTKNKVIGFEITIPYINLIEEYFFTRAFGLLIPYLKVDSLNTLNLVTPFVDGELPQKEKDESRKLINYLVNQVQPLNSDRDNFIVTSTQILNYECLKSSDKTNTYTYHFDYLY